MTNLRAFFISKRIALEGASGTLELIPLHPFGSFVGNRQTYVFDDTSLARVNAQLEGKPTGWPLDYHHATLKVEDGTRDKAPRAAQIVGVEVMDGYVYGRVADWVQDALESVLKGEWGYVSPVLLFDAAGRVVGYHSHALTNDPGTFDQRAIGLESSLEDGMELAALLKLLGLPADATLEAAKAALEAMNVKAAFGEAVAGIMSLEAKNTPEARAKVMRLVGLESVADQLDAARVALEAQATQGQTAQVEGVLKAALESGRIFEPEGVVWRTQLERDFDAAKIALEKMPVRVPTKPVTPAAGTQQAALEDSQAKANALLGIKLESFQKYNGGEA